MHGTAGTFGQIDGKIVKKQAGGGHGRREHCDLQRTALP